MTGEKTLVIVDAANVVGSVPDGWWRDRRGAAERLRDSLVPYAADGLPGETGPVEIVLVVEGAARGVPSVPGVRVEAGARGPAGAGGGAGGAPPRGGGGRRGGTPPPP
ncbi:hypothetical protein ACFXAX_34205, partial [Streptomyces sp. NPDC059446]